MADWEGRSGGTTRAVRAGGARHRSNDERGIAAIEAAILVSILLVPLILGIIQWGDYFWKAQKVDTLAPAVPEGQVAGVFTCEGLQDVVTAAVVDVVAGLDPDLPVVVPEDVVVTVLEVLPEVGVVVQIHLEVVVDGLSSLVPLPNGGAIITDFTQRFDDVTLSDQVCR